MIFKWLWRLAVVVAAMACLVSFQKALGAVPTAKPNVVMIISDDHGWTDYSFMSHPQVRTPHLDKLASQGILFSHGYVPSSLCCPSLASIVSGLYPHQHKITSNDPPIPEGMTQAAFQNSPAFLEGREVMNRHLEAVSTLPRLLDEQGYLSFQTGKWWQGDFRHGGFTHGMTKGGRHGDEGLAIGRQTMQPIYDFIQTSQREKRPFFLWYAPMLPHQPHNPPQRLFDNYKGKTPSPHVARYWAMVEWFDETCGLLLDYLDQQGLAENTIVVYVADNGWTQSPDKAGPIRSKLTPYDAGLRTPILIRWPGSIKPRKSEDLVMSIDLMPTLLAALGMKPTADMPGINLLDDEALRRRKAIYGECFTHNAVDLSDPAKNVQWRWMIEDRWKLIVPAAAGQVTELYDIQADPHESTNVAGRQPATVQEMRRKLDAWWNPAAH
jgi:uncharacterized sulfatase